MSENDNKQNNETNNENKDNGSNKKPLFIIAGIVAVAVIGVIIMNSKKLAGVVTNMTASDNAVSENLVTMTKEEFMASWADNDSDMSKAKVGDVVSFGRYEQDGNDYNYLEVIDWDVLAVSDNSVLLISHNILAQKAFHSDMEIITWAASPLRSWLNSQFIDEAFNDAEKARIKSVSLNNPNSFEYFQPFYEGYDLAVGTVGCDVTEDRVFLLDYEEVIEYYNLTIDKNLMGYGSENLVASVGAALPMSQYGYTNWWLRSPGETLIGYMIVSHDYINGTGAAVDDETVGVRPAMWVSY